MMSELLADVRYALRLMRRQVGFTATAVITLGLGIGSATIVFSLVHGILVRPLPYSAPERIVRLSEEYPDVATPRSFGHITNVSYHALLEPPLEALDRLAAYRSREYTVGFETEHVRLHGTEVSADLFAVLGAVPASGRFFTSREAAENTRAVVLGYRLWQQRFGSNPAAIGRALMIDGERHSIVGVASPGFSFPDSASELWTPFNVPRPEGTANPTVTICFALGRLKPAIPAARVAAESTARLQTLNGIPLGLRATFGSGNLPTIRARPLLAEMTSPIRPVLMLITAGAGFLLLIVCANVATLLLARGMSRRREFAVRAAIGASRLRLVRLQLTEALVLSLAGGVVGILLTSWFLNTVHVLASVGLPRLDEIRPDLSVFVIASVCTLTVAGVSTLTPALAVTADLDRSLRGGGGGGTGELRMVRAIRVDDLLLVIEATIAIVVLVAAGLLTRSLFELLRVDPGYTPDKVLTARVFLPGADATTATRRLALMTTILERLRAVPGVVAAGGGNMTPLVSNSLRSAFPAPSQRSPDASMRMAVARQYVVTPGYAEALGLRLLAGRLFTEADLASANTLWVVNREFARLYLPPDPVGLQFPWTRNDQDVQLEIIGVVDNVLKDGLDTQPEPEFYVFHREPIWWPAIQIVVRTNEPPDLFVPIVQTVIREETSDAALELMPLSKRLANSIARPRLITFAFGAFAAAALLLTAVGLFGNVAQAVARRGRELAIRAAIGATYSDLIGMLVSEALKRAACGAVIGLAGAYVTAQMMRGLLFEVSAVDVGAFAAAPTLLMAVSLIAALMAARRAARTDPADILRSE